MQKTELVLSDQPQEVLSDLRQVRELLADLLIADHPSEAIDTTSGVKSLGLLFKLINDLEFQATKQLDR